MSNLVYFISKFERRANAEHVAPWFVLSGTGNLDIPTNRMEYLVVHQADVWHAIDNWPWVDSPYVVTGLPANSYEEAVQLEEELNRQAAKRDAAELEAMTEAEALEKNYDHPYWEDDEDDEDEPEPPPRKRGWLDAWYMGTEPGQSGWQSFF